VSWFAALAEPDAYLERLFDSEKVVELFVSRSAVDSTDSRSRKSLTRSHELIIPNR
jgi:hypothetical protein